MSNTRFKPFSLGQIVSTPGALHACPADIIFNALTRHALGDWGCVCDEDAESNDAATHGGSRVLSAYQIDPIQPSEGHGANTLWIITEADRSVTTVLLPSEY